MADAHEESSEDFSDSTSSDNFRIYTETSSSEDLQNESISEANNSGLQTKQCLIGQVAGNPCRRRINTEERWPELKRHQRRRRQSVTSGPNKAQEWMSTEIMRNGLEILVWAIFPQVYLWVHDKYSSIRFKQCEWQRKILQDFSWLSGQKSQSFRWRKLGYRFSSQRGHFHFFFFNRFFTLSLFTVYSHCCRPC